ADADARDATGLADPDLAVGTAHEPERAVELVGEDGEGDRRGRCRSPCRQRELEQPTVPRLPAANVDQPVAPRRDLEDATREAEPRAGIGEEGDAPARG